MASRWTVNPATLLPLARRCGSRFLIDQMEKVGKQPEVVVVEPKEAHGFRDLQNNVNLYTKMLAFFDKYIGPGAKASTAGTP